MKNREDRKNCITQILKQGDIHSHHELLAALEKNGFVTTQATLSRDLKEMMISKVPDGNGGYLYVLPDANIHAPDSGIYGMLSYCFSGNICAIKTLPGHANSVAYYLDGLEREEFLATLAGDDAIFVLLKEGVARSDIEELMKNFMGKKV